MNIWYNKVVIKGGVCMIKNLRQLREENRISQQRLAEMLNTSQQSIFKYEKTTSEPDIATLIKLADIFGVSVDYLIGNSDVRDKNSSFDIAVLTAAERSHMRLWRSLTPDMRSSVDQLLQAMQQEKSDKE